MADQPRRRRMSRSVHLALLTSLPGLAGCGGCGAQPPPAPEPTEEVEEEHVDPPPAEPAHLLGAPFVAWWHLAHPPVIVRRTVPRSAVAAGGYTRTGTGYRRTYYAGRSGFLSGGSSSPGPAHSSPVSRGGFGSTGHAAAGG